MNSSTINALVALPPGEGSRPLEAAVRRASQLAGVAMNRDKRFRSPGPVSKEILDAFWVLDCLIADVWDSDPLVHYMVGIAHNRQLPTVLLVRRDRANEIPFDVRLNRVVLYQSPDEPMFVERLARSLSYVRRLVNDGRPESLDEHLRGLGASDPEAILELLVREKASEYGLSDLKRYREAAIWCQGYTVSFQDKAGEGVTLEIDVNGHVRGERSLKIG